MNAKKSASQQARYTAWCTERNTKLLACFIILLIFPAVV